MRAKIFWISLISLVLLLGCDAGKRDWQKAAEQGTITAYEEFLKKHPQHELAESARSKLDEIYFKQAQLENTIPEYEKFIQKYPQSRFKEKAYSAIENLYDQRHKAFRNVRTVKVIIKDSYGERNIRYPFRSMARVLFQDFAGLMIVRENAKSYDAIFRVESKYRPLSGSYKGKELYTGASLKGKISLEIPDVIVFKESFQEDKPVPFALWYLKEDWSKTVSEYSTPDSKRVPFSELFRANGSFNQLAMKMLGEVFGTSFLVSLITASSLDFEDYWSIQEFAVKAISKVEDPLDIERLIKAFRTSSYASRLLRKIKDPRSVEPLLNIALSHIDFYDRKRVVSVLGNLGDDRVVGPLILLMNNNPRITPYIAEALRKITGEDFRKSTMGVRNAWLNWWEQNKERYPQSG